MKYAVILPDGAADDPLPELGGRTPLEAARIPHLDWVAQSGRLGRMVTIPDGFTPGTDVGTLSVLGYDPHEYYTGRAPIEAAAMGLAVRPDQMIFRCNFVTVLDGLLQDNTAGHIPQAEADALVADLRTELAAEGCELYAGVSYRNLLLLSDAADLKLRLAPPHDILDQPAAAHAPAGTGAERVLRIEARARARLAAHEVNRRRRAEGRPPVTDIWLWGQGRPRAFEPFAERYGPRGAVITGVDILRGFGRLLGMEVLEVPGATGFLDTDYAGKGRAAVAALDRVDLIVVHVEAADEAAHMGSAEEKVRALERMDEAIVGPLLERLRSGGPWRALAAVDHPTPCTTRGHSAVPPLFAFAGEGIPAVERAPFTEAAADRGGFWIRPGPER
ncbi:MAG TPA: cofactor-independent phosphoglycerate mutase [Candidatus Saccharimonadales bacterium]|nr:cofactor-independent phosphoglycerate mutase [Candidatus Saccharimonadales bacterium]